MRSGQRHRPGRTGLARRVRLRRGGGDVFAGDHSEAGANVAAIHYHFGGRDQLLKVILDCQIGPLNAHRLRLLDAAVEQFGEHVSVEVLLELNVERFE